MSLCAALAVAPLIPCTGSAQAGSAGKQAILPVTYDGQRMNPGNETPKQMETLLRQQYIDWVLMWKADAGGKAVSELVPQARLRKLKYDLQRCSEENAKFRHPKPKEKSRVSTIRVDNRCAEERVTKALAAESSQKTDPGPEKQAGQPGPAVSH